MPQRNINITSHLDQFIDRSLASGRFSNASEIVREGLRMLEQREREDEAKIEWLRGAAQEGCTALESGDYTAIHSAEDLDAFFGEVRADLSSEPAAAPSRG